MKEFHDETVTLLNGQLSTLENKMTDINNHFTSIDTNHQNFPATTIYHTMSETPILPKQQAYTLRYGHKYSHYIRNWYIYIYRPINNSFTQNNPNHSRLHLYNDQSQSLQHVIPYFFDIYFNSLI